MTQTPTASPKPSFAEEYRRRGWWTGERLVDRFRGHVEASPERLAVADDSGERLTRAELWQRAQVFADRLGREGVQAGDVVMIYLPNSVQWHVVFLACLQLGTVPATLPVTSDQKTLAHIYELTNSRAIIASETSRRRPTGEWARDVIHGGARAGLLVVLGADGAEVRLRATGAVVPSRLPPEVSHLMFTSSTTGMPKGVMHSEDSLGSVNLQFAERFGVTADTPIFMPSPLGHSVGAWHGTRLALHTGAALILQDGWDPVRGLELVDEYGCGFSAAATPFLKDIVDAPWPADKPKLASLETFLCGGAPVPPSLLRQAHEQAPRTFVTVLWGMTEGTGTTCVPSSTVDQLTDSAGAPAPGLELVILDADENGVGELAIRGPQLFLGYVNQEELYRGLMTEDGFFRTGDQATIDEDGYLHLAGRLKDLIIRGGVNISPVPIEDAIAAHPAVRRVAVIGADDERLGERINAVIVPAATPPTLEELNAWLVRHGLSKRYLPEQLTIVDDMPVTAAGKIRKIELRSSLVVTP